jgi:hypothetical protein
MLLGREYRECVKAPGMTAPDGRGSVVQSTVFQSRDLRERSAALVGWAAGPWELPAVMAR